MTICHGSFFKKGDDNMLCDLCSKRKAVKKYKGEIEIQVCEICYDLLFEKNIRYHYGGQLYEFVNQLKKIRQSQSEVKKMKKKRKRKKMVV